ncbi:uncharacterized protein B0I36DRAFT_263075 [Microdochium trichocladiopsis]|uniref:DUF4484 domain-containing protein n=1 Tax=Microdochium trichocladiopsis TaxID=1682393 RepID=A0A9P8YFB0_9PEZI|nr:uncharacterized protein B0I36DRAFT_263075 [Microdochium trichocladiopsis]KAH7038179.1 hypothetical protein B0I36DRAFT_263075 [Microdochium trichocladiopsis]
MAASRRGQPELHVRLPTQPLGPVSSLTTATPLPPDLPPISALFLIEFDVKAGYTISWKAAQPGVDLEGAVEYKSLPSGLHAVSEDLIYFVHEQYAGLSAFINAPVEDSQLRNARMLAVGVLVPLSYGRLGRAWKHAEGLKELVSALSTDVKDTAALQQYWDKNHAREDKAEDGNKRLSLDSPSVTFQSPTIKTPNRGHARKRSASDGAGILTSGHKLSPYHPAWSLTKLLDTFGPLIFPIQRAALLRKRILISCHAPVHEACNFVYDISILSNIPLSSLEVLSPEGPSHRLRPLFTVGVHDIPFLVDDAKQEPTIGKDEERGTGWIACTTDSILAMKETLWDVLITMPTTQTANPSGWSWPTVQGRGGVTIRATQRDLRRFKALKRGLARLQTVPGSAVASPSPSRPNTSHQAEGSILDEAESIVEPHTWAALAYNGFMWWASAGEQARSDEAEEAAQDASLLADLSSSMSMSHPSGDVAGSIGSLERTRRLSTSGQQPDEAQVELAIIAYFHRLTSNMLSVAGEVVEAMRYNEIEIGQEAANAIDDDETSSPTESEREHLLADSGDSGRIEDDDDDDDTDSINGGRGVRVDNESISRMGLDVWSPADAKFACELLQEYYGRRAYVEGKVVEICGVRVC